VLHYEYLRKKFKYQNHCAEYKLNDKLSK